MPTSYDDFAALPRSDIVISKPGFNCAVANRWYLTFSAAGYPAPGTDSPGSTTVGIKPVAGNVGYPPMVGFPPPGGGGEYLPYIANVTFTNAGATATGPTLRAKLVAIVARLGTYNFNANTNLTTPLTFDVGQDNHPDYEIWVQFVTAVTGTILVEVFADSGNAYFSDSFTAPAAGTMWRLGEGALSQIATDITNVTGSGASAGTFNIIVLRRLWQGVAGPLNAVPYQAFEGIDVHVGLGHYLPPPGALAMMVSSTATGAQNPEMVIDVVQQFLPP